MMANHSWGRVWDKVDWDWRGKIPCGVWDIGGRMGDVLNPSDFRAAV